MNDPNFDDLGTYSGGTPSAQENIGNIMSLVFVFAGIFLGCSGYDVPALVCVIMGFGVFFWGAMG